MSKEVLLNGETIAQWEIRLARYTDRLNFSVDPPTHYTMGALRDAILEIKRLQEYEWMYNDLNDS